jgi:hypothetical protein
VKGDADADAPMSSEACKTINFQDMVVADY